MFIFGVNTFWKAQSFSLLVLFLRQLLLIPCSKSLKRCCQKNYKAQNALHLLIGCHGSQPTQLCLTWDKLTLEGKELAVYWTRT